MFIVLLKPNNIMNAMLGLLCDRITIVSNKSFAVFANFR